MICVHGEIFSMFLYLPINKSYDVFPDILLLSLFLFYVFIGLIKLKFWDPEEIFFPFLTLKQAFFYWIFYTSVHIFRVF